MEAKEGWGSGIHQMRKTGLVRGIFLEARTYTTTLGITDWKENKEAK